MVEYQHTTSGQQSWLSKLGKSKESVTEDLYSTRGIQSAIVGDYFRNSFNLDPTNIDSKFLIETQHKRRGNHFFEVRPLASANRLGVLELKDTFVHINNPDVLVSLPLFCKMTGLSMSEVAFQEYIVKLKHEYNHWDWLVKLGSEFDELRRNYRQQYPNENKQFNNDFFMKNHVTWDKN